MVHKVCIAQSTEELKFILNSVKNNEIICIPLNLSTQLFCIRNKINFYNPIDYINNNFYENVLVESENLIKTLKTDVLKFESHIKEYKALIRFKFYSAAFLYELIEKISEQNKIDEIIVSGWNKYIDQYSNKNYFISNLIEDLVTNIKIRSLSEPEKERISSREERIYEILNKSLNMNKEYILMNNIGYNFKRIIFFIQKKSIT